jgi:DNA-binding NarL/FixJ family response regulator
MDCSDQSPRSILLFGPGNLQTTLLAGFLTQRVEIACQHVGNLEWPEFLEFPVENGLALIDADMGSLDDYRALLGQLCTNSSVSVIAFFNTPAGHSVEQLMVWPKVNGLFYAEASQTKLVEGIEALFEGEYWLPRRLLGMLLEANRQPLEQVPLSRISLTRRERQILRLTTTGATNREIALALDVSTHTVKTHIYNLFKKLGASNRVQAVNWAKANMPDLTVGESLQTVEH